MKEEDWTQGGQGGMREREEWEQEITRRARRKRKMKEEGKEEEEEELWHTFLQQFLFAALS